MKVKKITFIDVKNLPEGTRLSYTYSIIDEDTGKIIDSNAKGSFVILDNLEIEFNGVNKNVLEAANILFKAAENKLQ